MKRRFLGLTGVFLCLLLAACAAGREAGPLTVSAETEPLRVQPPPECQTGEVQFRLPPGEYLGEFIVAGDTVYFERGRYTDTDVVVSAAVCRRDEDGTEEILYTEEREDGGPMEVSELCLAGDRLFWVYQDLEETSIKSYDLGRGEAAVVETYPAEEGLHLTLASDDRFLTWCAAPRDGAPLLYALDTADGQVTCLSDRLGAVARAYVWDGVTSYLETRGDQGTGLVVFDLENGRELANSLLPEDFAATEVQADRAHTVVRAGQEDTGLYLLDAEKGQLRELDYSARPGIRLFSWHLMGDAVLINSPAWDQFPDELAILSLKDAGLSWIPLEHRLTSGRVREPDQFSAEFSSADEDGVVTAHIVYYRFPG